MRREAKSAPRSARLLTILAVAAALGLSACTNYGTSAAVVRESYHPRALVEANSDGGIYTVVIGNPFDVPKDELDRRMVALLSQSHFGPDVEFRTEKPDRALGHRVVFLFNPAFGISRDRLCLEEADSEIETVKGSPVRIVGVFCRSDKFVTAVNGDIPDPKGLDDRDFNRLVAQMAVTMFPPQTPIRANGGEFDL